TPYRASLEDGAEYTLCAPTCQIREVSGNRLVGASEACEYRGWDYRRFALYVKTLVSSYARFNPDGSEPSASQRYEARNESVFVPRASSAVQSELEGCGTISEPARNRIRGLL